jgi:tryptophan halogenase
MKNIIVVGGGTAGWLTALYAKKSFPNENIVVVESKEIGILGAGEGSTAHIIDFFKYLDIPITELILNTKSTIKTGIKFTNWSNTSEFYYHGFRSNYPETIGSEISLNYNTYDMESFSVLDILSYSQNKDTNINDFISKFSEDKKVPFIEKTDSNGENFLDVVSGFSIHFDARLLAEYLSHIGKSRGISVIDGVVSEINSDENGFIRSISVNDLKIDTDFLFDCTGFARLFIGKHFNSKWISFSESLPMKKAIPFFINIDKENIPPYTEAIAMNYGWMWKIPLQHRYGCGYVYDSDFISDEEAKKEIENFLGFIPEYPRNSPFLFNAGTYEDIWVKNCLSVGLSSSFIEPLEATSIFYSINILKKFFNNKHHIFNFNDQYVKDFNNESFLKTKSIVDFIFLHYMTNKNNNDFWKNFIENNKMPESLNKKLFSINNSILYNNDPNSLFLSESYYKITSSLKILNLENLNNIVNSNNLKRFTKQLDEYNKLNNKTISSLMSHSSFLNKIVGI